MSIILDSSQKQAVDNITKWYFDANKQQYILGGVAGSGKSTCVSTVVQEVNIANQLRTKKEFKVNEEFRNEITKVFGVSLLQGNAFNTELTVVYATYTGKAALELRKKGHNASTMHSLLYHVQTVKDPETGKSKVEFVLRPKDFFKGIDLIIIDEASMVTKKLYDDLLSLDIKVLFLGDHAQLAAPFDDIGLMKNADCYLDTIHRYAGYIAQICDLARHGKPIKYGSYGKEVAKVKWDQVTVEHFAKVSQIICNTNKTRTFINHFVRDHLGFTTSLPMIGEKLICLKNNSQNGLINGLFATTTKAVDPTFDVNMNKLIVSLSVETELGFSLDNVKCDLTKFKPELTDNENYNEFSMREYDAFDFGHAITVYKSQGSQFDKVMVVDDVFGDEDNRRRSRYTAYSRTQNKLIIVNPY